jgi:hypothetical protein
LLFSRLTPHLRGGLFRSGWSTWLTSYELGYSCGTAPDSNRTSPVFGGILEDPPKDLRAYWGGMIILVKKPFTENQGDIFDNTFQVRIQRLSRIANIPARHAQNIYSVRSHSIFYIDSTPSIKSPADFEPIGGGWISPGL